MGLADHAITLPLIGSVIAVVGWLLSIVNTALLTSEEVLPAASAAVILTRTPVLFISGCVRLYAPSLASLGAIPVQIDQSILYAKVIGEANKLVSVISPLVHVIV